MPANNNYEQRTIRAEIREAGSTGQVIADVVTFEVVDSYGTMFSNDAFDESLAERMPKICWAHNWEEPIGQWTKAEKVEVGGLLKLRLTGQLDIHEDVPRARQALAQLKSGTMDQFSVGFWRLADEKVEDAGPGIYRITKAGLDEASPVISGAVPGTALVGVRSKDTTPTPAARAKVVRVDEAVDLARKIAEGDITHEEAQVALSLLATDTGDDDTPPADGDDTDPPDTDDGTTDDTTDADDPDAELADLIDADLAAFDDLDSLGERWSL